MKKIIFLILIIFLIYPNNRVKVYAHDNNLGIETFEGITYDECEHSYYIDSNNIGDEYDVSYR